MKFLTAKPYILAELVLLTVLLPLAIVKFHLIQFMLPTLWIVAAYCLFVHRRITGERLRDVWRGRELTWAAIKPVLRILALSALFLGVATYVLLPDRLFSFVLERPAFWALVMVAYPLISVVPQEIIFRMFFFERYQHIFKSRELMIIASGLAFGMAHLIFENWVAPLLTAVGGILFALTYSKKRSLALVSLEHALYGDFIFTIGLGYYFYHGTVAAMAQVAH